MLTKWLVQQFYCQLKVPQAPAKMNHLDNGLAYPNQFKIEPPNAKM